MPNQPASLDAIADLVRQAAADPERAAALLAGATDEAAAADDHGAVAFFLLAAAAFAGQTDLTRAREALGAGYDLRTGAPFGPDGRPIVPPSGPRHGGPRAPGMPAPPPEEPAARALEHEPGPVGLTREQRARDAMERFRALLATFVESAPERPRADLESWAARLLTPPSSPAAPVS